jgi:hypothetical protein
MQQLFMGLVFAYRSTFFRNSSDSPFREANNCNVSEQKERPDCRLEKATAWQQSSSV